MWIALKFQRDKQISRNSYVSSRHIPHTSTQDSRDRGHTASIAFFRSGVYPCTKAVQRFQYRCKGRRRRVTETGWTREACRGVPKYVIYFVQQAPRAYSLTTEVPYDLHLCSSQLGSNAEDNFHPITPPPIPIITSHSTVIMGLRLLSPPPH